MDTAQVIAMVVTGVLACGVAIEMVTDKTDGEEKLECKRLNAMQKEEQEETP